MRSKRSTAWTLLTGMFIGMGIMFFLTMSTTVTSAHVEKYYVEGDELPGIGGSDDVPDTCYAWYDQKDQMMHVANSSWMTPRDHGKPIK